jgi:N-acetylgalactosamine kinase
MPPWEDQQIVSIILAGGRGIRMRCDTKHKVCFEVGGVPVILRALQTYKQCGIDHNIIVVGALGEQVLHTVGGRVPDVTFAYQPEPRGTGNATRCGAQVLQDVGYDGLILVVVGDRLIAPHVVHRLLAAHRDTNSDVVFLVARKADYPNAGRVVFDGDGNAVAVVETSEIALSNLIGDIDGLLAQHGDSVPAGEVLASIRKRFPIEAKARKACGELYTWASSDESLDSQCVARFLEPLRERASITVWIDGSPRTVRAAEVEQTSDLVNISTYLFRAPALYKALSLLRADNAQEEEFMTDCIASLGSIRDEGNRPAYKITDVCLEHPDDSMAFNTPEELAEIERKMRLERPGEDDLGSEAATNGMLRPAQQWRHLFASNSPEIAAFMDETYGAVPDLQAEKRRAFLTALDAFIREYGPDRSVLIVRSPGRVNLMGRHVDHRGGNTNVIAISDEIIMVASPREDDYITLVNTQEELFERRQFSISQDIADLDWSDWLTCINSPKTLALVSGGDWANYVRAAALRLQERFRRHPLRGADVITHGTIPIGSGLSSSSASVVGAAEILVAVNGLPVKPSILVDLCGEGEWFVGTRGGATDHAAIKFGKRGSVGHVGFFPFEIHEFLPFFRDYSVVVCNSGVQARKSEHARTTFNEKVLGYVTAEIIFKQLMTAFTSSVHHLRDITCENLGIDLMELYQVLKQIPLSLTRERLFSEYGPFSPDDSRKLRNLLATLEEDDGSFDVRGVMLYGLAEIDRAKRCIEFLRAGDPKGFGELCYTSHDGDRVVCHDDSFAQVPWNYEVDDEYLDGLIADLRSGDRARIARAQLHLQPGKYSCSTPEIDLIVDVARRQEGVVGAQLAGAGLGGCAIILVRDEGCRSIIEALAEHGFEAKQYFPVEGAGIIKV